jgi:N-acetylmuramoyl-L-alanine amidase
MHWNRLRLGVGAAALTAALVSVGEGTRVGLASTVPVTAGATTAVVANPGAGVPVGATPADGGAGLWIVDTDAAVADDGTAPREPSVEGRTPQPVVGIAAARRGYWLVGAGGHVTAVGGAPSLTGVDVALTEPVIGILGAATGGYWIYTRGGRIFPAGAARNFGSVPGWDPSSPVASMAARPDGRGYWLVERDGHVLSYGAARTYGYPSGLASPIVAMAATADGGGYWLLTRAGRVYAYGDAPHLGSARPYDAPVLGLVPSAGDTGYWILGDDGRVRAFGTARSVRWVGSAGRSLVGAVVTLDPGHNGGNFDHTAAISRLVPSGPGMEKACDTTGTETDGGYTEAAFNFSVVTDLAGDLEADGAHVVLTRTTNAGVGPCVDQRAEIGNRADSDVALSVHADGGPPDGRGFSILLPGLFRGYNNAVVGPSDRLGDVLRTSMLASRVLPVSDYYGTDGLEVRYDLGGLNLSRVPKVLIEVGNMRNAADAALQVQPSWRRRVAEALAQGLSSFLLTTGP